jgi:hypothetical protein
MIRSWDFKLTGAPPLLSLVVRRRGGSRMGFRRPKSDDHRRGQEWHAWIDRHRAELAAIGLPVEVYLDAARWQDFLENGHLHWHPSSGFEFGELSPAQLEALHRFLEREYGAADRPPPLLGWARVRCAQAPGAAAEPGAAADRAGGRRLQG